MSETTAKGFKVPKIKRQESKDNLRTVELKSRDAQEISNLVARSYLERNYKSPWELKVLHFVDNKELEDSYRVKKVEMKDDGRHSRDLADQYAFLMFRDSTMMAKVIKQGLVARPMPFNALGASKFGVYLCRNADVQLRLAEGKGLTNCTLVVFKITLGKCKTLAQQSMTEGENIEPTPNYDCHIPQVQAKPSDSLYLQLARSQVYLYEYTDECIPSERPRQCLPYAILSYEKQVVGETASESTSGYGKQTVTSTSSTVKTEQTPADQGTKMKRTVSYSDTTEKSFTSSMGQRSRSDPNFVQQQSVETPIGTPLQANIIRAEPRPRDPRLARMGDTRVNPADPRNRPGDPRLNPVDPRLNKGGPRFSGEPKPNQNDSRRYLGDPRTQMRPTDPRLNIVPGSLRPNQTDIKTGQAPPVGITGIPLPNLNDPRLNPIDPRLSEQSLNFSDPRNKPFSQPNIPTDPRMNQSDPRINAFSQNIGQMHGRSVVDPRLRGNPNINLQGQNVQSSIGHPASQDPSSYEPSFGPPAGGLLKSNFSTDLREQNSLISQSPAKTFPQHDLPLPRDPRLRHKLISQEQSQEMASPIKSNSDSRLLDPNSARKKLSIDEYKKKVEVLVKIDDRYKQFDQIPTASESVFEGVDETVHFENDGLQPSGSDMSIDLERQIPMKNNLSGIRDSSITPPYSPSYAEPSDQNEFDSAHDDIVTSPYMMMQTLSALSEPDDISMSPKETEGESDSFQADNVDSALTVAIRKLVEHSSDMAVLTQAVQVLGQTHDMKDILEALKKAMISSIKPDAEKSTENNETPADLTAKEIEKPESPVMKAVNKTFFQIKNDGDEKEEKEPDEKLKNIIGKISSSTESVTEIPMPDSSPLGDTPLKDKQDPKFDQGVKFYLNKDEEKCIKAEIISEKGALQKTSMKDLPSIGYSPHKSVLSEDFDKDDCQKTTKTLFRSDTDEGKRAIENKLHTDLYQPSVDKDERKICMSPILSPSESLVVEDIDERKHHSRSASPKLGIVPQDVDERKSHSRSMSPITSTKINSSLKDDTDDRSLSPMIPGLSKSAILDVDERKSRSRSHSPMISQSTSAIIKRERNYPTPIMSPDPESSDSLKDNLLNRNNNSISDPSQEEKSLDIDLRQSRSENEFGDVDWRWTAATEMGDVDLRAKPGQAQAGDYGLPPVFEAVNDFWDKREKKDRETEFRESLGSNKIDYTHSKPYESYSTRDSKYESYETSKNKIPSYSTTGNVYGEYSSSNKAETTNLNMPFGSNYPAVQPPMFYPQNPNFIPPPQQATNPQQPDVMNFNSLLGSVNLDFANLKNILATVQKPSDDKPKPARLPGEGVVEEEEVTSNLPAFVTGLCTESPKKDTSLSKYSGKPREWVQGRKPFFPKEELPEKPVPKDPNYDPTRAPQLQKPKVEVKYERNFEPLDPQRHIIKQEQYPKTGVEYDRNFEPVLQKPKTEMKYDRNFEPLDPQRHIIKQEQNLTAEAVLVSDKTEKIKKDLATSSTSSEIKTELDKNESVAISTSGEIENVKNEPVSISVSRKTEKDETKPVSKSSSCKTEKVENKPVSISVSAKTEKVQNLNNSNIKQGELRNSSERAKKEIKQSDAAKQKEYSGTDPSKKHLIFSIGDMVKQVRETSGKDTKTAKSTEENIKKRADKPITSVKDTKRAKSPEDDVNKRADKPMIFSIGDMVKRVRETSGKKDVRKTKCDEDNTNNRTDKKKKKSSPKKLDSENEKHEEKDGKDQNTSNMTPYQKAIMESLETSDLRIRHDDSIVSEIDESPKGDKRSKTHGKDLESKTNTEKSKKSRFNDYKKMELDDVSDTSDDEKFGLVIDLGETPAKKLSEHVNDPERHMSGHKPEGNTEENLEPQDGADDCLMVEMETAKPEVVDLTEDDHDMGTDDTSMKRNTKHEIEEDLEGVPLLKKIKVEKLAEDLEKERRLAEEAKLAEAFGADKSDSELDMDEHIAAQGDRMKKVIGQQPRKKIVINLKSTGRKSKNKTEESNVNNEKPVAENKTDKEKVAKNEHVSKTDERITDKAKLQENRQEKIGTESGPIRTVQRLGQRNVSEPRASSPITVLGMASHRTPSPLTAQKINSDTQPSSISAANVQKPVPLDTVSPVSQPWSKHEQQHPIQSVHSNQYSGNMQALPDLSQISSIPPPNYRSPSPVNQMVSVMSSLGAAGFRSSSPVNALGSAFIVSTMQNLQSMIASNMGSGVTVPMPPVGPLPTVGPIATIGHPPFQPLAAPPNLAIPPPNLNQPPPNISHQPLSQHMGPLPYPMQPDTRLGNLVQVTQDPVGPFPQIHGSFSGPPRPNMSNLPGPLLSSPGLMPTMQGNLTIPVIGQTQQTQKEAMLQDVLQRARQRAAEIVSAPPSEGMPIQTIGQAASTARPKNTNTNLKPVETTDVEDKTEPRSKDDVLDWFTDKFDIKKELKHHSTPVRQMEEPMNEYSETPDSSSGSGRKRMWEYESDEYGKKLKLAAVAESQAEHYYESNLDSEQSDVVNVLQQHSVENLNKAKDVILKSLASLPAEASEVGEMKSEHGMESSDLEEGELSEDSSITGSPLITDPDNRRVVIQNKVGNNIQVMCAANNIQRIQTIGADKPSSPERVVGAADQPVTSQTKGHHKNLAAVDWADMLQRTSRDSDPRERRVSAFQRLDSSDSRSVSQKPSVSADEKGHNDNTDGAGILASTAAHLTKTKQKLMARGQVKTLGDWLKLELEIENIQPLQKYIPYAFNTDLTAIPKGRRRKIKGKVRTVLEKEGKASGLIQQAIADQSNIQPAVSVTVERTCKSTEQTKPVHRGPPINPSYTPEVPNSQIQCELELVKKIVSGLRDRSGDRRGPRSGYHIDATRGKIYVTLNSKKTLVEPGSEAEIQVMTALQTVETEMVTMLQRTYFYGYPHRRVPKDLLLESELYSFKSPHQDIFLILMMPLSIKPYNKLLAMKKEIEALLKRTEGAKNSEELEKELKNLHVQREGVIRSFTGYLNKKRVTKLQDLVNKYTLAYDFFKGQPRPPADSALKFIRTTQIDLRQHLLLAKQYLAMDEKKLVVEVKCS